MFVSVDLSVADPDIIRIQPAERMAFLADLYDRLTTLRVSHFMTTLYSLVGFFHVQIFLLLSSVSIFYFCLLFLCSFTSVPFPPSIEYSGDEISPQWSDTCYNYPSPEEDRPLSYPSSQHPTLHPHPPKAPPSARPDATSTFRWSGYSQTLPPSPPKLDINSNPKPCFLHLTKQSSLTEPHASEPNVSPLYIKTPLVLTKPDPSGTPNLPTMSASPPWLSCSCARDKGTKLTR